MSMEYNNKIRWDLMYSPHSPHPHFVTSNKNFWTRDSSLDSSRRDESNKFYSISVFLTSELVHFQIFNEGVAE